MSGYRGMHEWFAAIKQAVNAVLATRSFERNSVATGRPRSSRKFPAA